MIERQLGLARPKAIKLYDSEPEQGIRIGGIQSLDLGQGLRCIAGMPLQRLGKGQAVEVVQITRIVLEPGPQEEEDRRALRPARPLETSPGAASAAATSARVLLLSAALARLPLSARHRRGAASPSSPANLSDLSDLSDLSERWPWLHCAGAPRAMRAACCASSGPRPRSPCPLCVCAGGPYRRAARPCRRRKESGGAAVASVASPRTLS